MVVLICVLKFILLLRFPTNVSIAETTRVRYGEDVLSTFRKWERLSIKHGKALLDLQFLRNCRDADLIPCFLQFKLSNSRLQKSKDVSRFRRRLLDKEIKSKEKKTAYLSEQISLAKYAFKCCVRHIDFIHYDSIIEDSVKQLSDKSSKIQNRKILKLRSNARSTNGLLDIDSVITNTSSYELSDIEKLALSRGLKYALPPSKISTGDYFSNFEVLFNDLEYMPFNGSKEDKSFLKQKVGELAYSSLYNFNLNRSKLMNMPREQFEALIKLSKNKDIVIAKPDKRSGIFILDREDYVNKMKDILSDESKFILATNQDIYKISRSTKLVFAII